MNMIVPPISPRDSVTAPPLVGSVPAIPNQPVPVPSLAHTLVARAAPITFSVSAGSSSSAAAAAVAAQILATSALPPPPPLPPPWPTPPHPAPASLDQKMIVAILSKILFEYEIQQNTFLPHKRIIELVNQAGHSIPIREQDVVLAREGLRNPQNLSQLSMCLDRSSASQPDPSLNLYQQTTIVSVASSSSSADVLAPSGSPSSSSSAATAAVLTSSASNSNSTVLGVRKPAKRKNQARSSFRGTKKLRQAEPATNQLPVASASSSSSSARPSATAQALAAPANPLLPSSSFSSVSTSVMEPGNQAKRRKRPTLNKRAQAPSTPSSAAVAAAAANPQVLRPFLPPAPQAPASASGSSSSSAAAAAAAAVLAAQASLTSASSNSSNSTSSEIPPQKSKKKKNQITVAQDIESQGKDRRPFREFLAQILYGHEHGKEIILSLPDLIGLAIKELSKLCTDDQKNIWVFMKKKGKSVKDSQPPLLVQREAVGRYLKEGFEIDINSADARAIRKILSKKQSLAQAEPSASASSSASSSSVEAGDTDNQEGSPSSIRELLAQILYEHEYKNNRILSLEAAGELVGEKLSSLSTDKLKNVKFPMKKREETHLKRQAVSWVSREEIDNARHRGLEISIDRLDMHAARARMRQQVSLASVKSSATASSSSSAAAAAASTAFQTSTILVSANPAIPFGRSPFVPVAANTPIQPALPLPHSLVLTPATHLETTAAQTPSSGSSAEYPGPATLPVPAFPPQIGAAPTQPVSTQTPSALLATSAQYDTNTSTALDLGLSSQEIFLDSLIV